MSYPILYDPSETNFENNGIGILSDCVVCECTEEANGIFELNIQYDSYGIHFEEIELRSIIKAKVDRFRDPQLFRVYSISKPMLNVSTIMAAHISYDLSWIPVSPFSANNVSDALNGLKTNAVIECPFEFWTDKNTASSFSSKVPASIRSKLGGSEGSILDVYGGEYEFDNYAVRLYNNRGEDRNFSVRYGKNLTNLTQDENCANVYTGIYPYWADEEGNNFVELSEKILTAPGEYDFQRIKVVDMSSEFEEIPTESELRSKANSYMSNNEIGIPDVSISVSFIQLDQTAEYSDLSFIEMVSLFDTVNVEFPKMKVSATAKVVKIVYDVILERFKSITLGKGKKIYQDSVSARFSKVEKEISGIKTKISKAKE